MNYDFVYAGTAAGMIHNAVEGFVQLAVLDIPRGILFNTISPVFLRPSIDMHNYCPSFEAVIADKMKGNVRKNILS